MEQLYYDADSLLQTLESFERRYGMSSTEFYEAHKLDDPTVAPIPGFHRHVWASFYLDVKRLRSDDFADRIERALELA